MKASGFTEAILLLFCISGSFRLSFTSSTPCALRATAHGHVCVCNTTYCDYLDPVQPSGDDGIVLTSSSKVGLRFSRQLGKFSNKNMIVNDWQEENNDMTKGDNASMVTSMQSDASIHKTKVKIDRSKKHQKIVGFGGAFTGAVSHNLKLLPQGLQDAVYQSYFAKEGINYNTIRMTIGGSDFDLEPWAYNERPENDINLSNFTKLNDLDLKKVEQIERLKSVANIDDIKILASAWSPPKWMKTLYSWHGFSFVQPRYYQTWANYHLKFIELMQEQSLPIWAITTGNEPLNSIFYTHTIKFMSVGWTPNSQAIWVSDNLGPTIKYSKFKDVKIFSNDDQIYTFPFWFKAMNTSRKDSLDFLDGLAVHWYWDDYYGPSLIQEAHDLMPDKLVYNTESTVIGKPKLGSWANAEKYAKVYMADLQYSMNGYIDWNMVLNEEGGPTYISNFCDSAIIANTTSKEEIYKQPLFYAIGHFTKFVPEGSVRIDSHRSNKNVDSVAFERPDGTVTCVLFNEEEEETVVTLVDSVRGNIDITIPPKSLHTIEYK